MLEIEAKFAGIDVDALRKAMLLHGFSCIQAEKLMRRKIFFLDENKPQLYGRVRDEGHRITMTIKEIIDDSINGVYENELIINDFDAGVLFMERSGWRVKAYQETKRETWQTSDDVEVVIDTWPGLPPFCEIEAATTHMVKETAEKLGFDWSQALFGAVDVMYWHHLRLPSEIINNIPVITFANPPTQNHLF